MEIPNLIHDYSVKILLLNVIIGFCSLISNTILIYAACKARRYLNLSISVSFYIGYVLCIQIIPVYQYGNLLQAYEWMFMSIIATMIVELISMETSRNSSSGLILFARVWLGIFSVCSLLLPPLFSDSNINTAISLLFLPHLIYLFVITYMMRDSRSRSDFDGVGNKIYVNMFCECGVIIFCKFVYLQPASITGEVVTDYIMYRLFFNILPFAKYCYYMWILRK